MKRWIAASTVALLLVSAAYPVGLLAAKANKTVTGTVGAVSPSSITIKAKDAEVTLVVDSKTQVIGTGVGTKTAKMKEEKKSPQIVDFVKAGDEVSATYDETTKHASEVRLVKPAAK